MSSARSRRLIPLLLAAAGLAYPFSVYFGLGRLPSGVFVGLALGLVAGRLAVHRGTAVARALGPALGLVAAATAAAALLDATAAAKAYPVLMSLGMAAAFGLSLRWPPTLIESFAAVVEPSPGAAARAYMRRVTVAWCLFLLGNAGLSAASWASGDLGLWTLYNGLVAYLLIGLMFGGEYLIRCRVRRLEAGDRVPEAGCQRPEAG
jgi:uncharacterized membrane protein